MRKPRIGRALYNISQNAGFLTRLLCYDLFIGSRDGFVKIGSCVNATGTVDIHLGNRVFLGRNGIFQGTGEVRIGAGTYVGNFFNFNSRSAIVVGDNCMFGNFVTLVDNNHGTATTVDMKHQPFEMGAIVIERNCWLGEKVTVLAGVTVHENAIVAAGSVVTHDVPANAIVAGVPAKVLRSRIPAAV